MTKILVVDDEPALRRVVCRMLKGAGFEAIEASGGREALALAGECAPDLIFCDVVMPELNGYETLELFRKNPELATVPFVFLTGKAQRQDQRQGMQRGADDYLVKPFNRDELLGTVKTQLEKKALLEKASERRIDELRGKIMYVLPHELRTPLSAILGLSELLANEAEEMDAEQVASIGQGLLDSGTRLSRIIENYLVYSQIEMLAASPRDLEVLRQETVAAPEAEIERLAREAAAAAGRSEDLRVALDVPVAVRMSTANFQKMIRELLDNAFKFSPKGTPVAVCAMLEGPLFVLQIHDQGRGMRPEEVAAIGAYHQFNRDQHEQAGTGLGLVIAKRLAELHSGRLTIESVAEKSTMVRVELDSTVVLV
jgi:signal transduction histidine kinase